MMLLNKGDRAAYEEIYNRYATLLYVYAYKKLKSKDDAQDAVQHVFISLWKRHLSISLTVSLPAYLYSAVRNYALTSYAHKQVKNKYMQAAAANVSISYENADYLIREKDITELVEREINLLPPRMRSVFMLSRTDGLSYKQIAETLNISEETVSTQMKRALKTLRTRLGVVLYLSILANAEPENKNIFLTCHPKPSANSLVYIIARYGAPQSSSGKI